MKRLFFILATTLVLLSAGACKKAPPPEAPARIQPRTDFAPHEFGIGKPHTKNNLCNREIDEQLEQIRQCYNTSTTAECEVLQRSNTERINRLKNAAHCSHGNAQR